MKSANPKQGKIRVLLALPLLYMLLIFYVSSLAGGSLQTGVSVSDKLLHFLEYAVLSALLYTAFRGGLGLRPKQAHWLSILLAVVYGASDEWHQSFVPGRDMSIYDWYADCLGAIAAQALIYIGRVARRRR
ncbi:MAG TPA: VanZ family protein [Firmicutes bacterium]|nr:VanZ family protein [Bacillota bacterium]